MKHFSLAAPRNPRATIMQRMSDMLTRWLDGNLRQNHANDSTGSQSEPGQQGIGANQEPAQEQTGAQSLSTAETVSPSNENVVNETLPVQQPVETSNSESEIPSVYMDIAEDDELCSRPEGNSAIENIPNSDKQIETDSESVQPPDQSVVPGQSGYRDEGSDHFQCSPDSNKDSSDTKSDESQSSFVHKIASMEMDDCETVRQTDFEAIGDPNSEYVQDHIEKSNRIPTDPKSLPYNPLFPTVYEENIEYSISDAKQSDKDNVCDIANSASTASGKNLDESKMELNFEINETERMTCDTDCDIDNDKVVCEPVKQSNDDETVVRNETVINPERTSATEQSEVAESSTQTAFDDSTLTLAAEQTMIRQTMEAAVETLRERNLEPVISLHYSSESTSNSTITLGFVNFGDLQDPSSVGVTENPVVSSQSGVNLPVAPRNVGSATASEVSSQSGVSLPVAPRNVGSATTSEVYTSGSSVDLVQQQQTAEENNVNLPSASKNDVRREKDTDLVNPDSETSHQIGNNLDQSNTGEISNSNKHKHEILPNIAPESSQDPISSKSDEVTCKWQNITNISDDNSVHIPCDQSANLEENSDHRDSCIESDVIASDYLMTDDMLHSGIIVTASDNDKNENPDTSNNSETVLPQQSSSDSTAENESNSRETRTFSIPDVAITDSQYDLESVESTERATDPLMDNDNESSDFDRVLNEVLGSSDDSDSPTAREGRLEAVRRHRVGELLSRTGEKLPCFSYQQKNR